MSKDAETGEAEARAAVAAFLEREEPAMFRLLEELVNIQSGTGNKAGVDAVAGLLRSRLDAWGFSTRLVPRAATGDVLIADLPAAAAASRRILLNGHMDTVFPADTPFRNLRREGDRVVGPGVADMKGGLVVGIYALLALREAGAAEDLPARFLFSPDEEASSASMRCVLRDEPPFAACALVFEMAGPEGEVVRSRRGRVGLSAEVSGRAGHAAFVVRDKASALLDAAAKAVALEALNAGDAPDFTVNVGVLRAGSAANVVPEKARIEVEARGADALLLAGLEERMRTILLAPATPGTRAEILRREATPPLPRERTEHLYALAEAEAAALGLRLGGEDRPGASEASLMAACGVPVLDGLGPCGGCDHSDREYILLPSLKERALLTAGLILRARKAFLS